MVFGLGRRQGGGRDWVRWERRGKRRRRWVRVILFCEVDLVGGGKVRICLGKRGLGWWQVVGKGASVVMCGFPRCVGTGGGVYSLEGACLNVGKRAAHFLLGDNAG